MQGDQRETDGMNEQARDKFVDFAEAPTERARPLAETLSPSEHLWQVLLPLTFAFFLTILWFAMRGLLERGGAVATGGPYEIAHPAPGYTWVVPLAVIACVVIALWSLGTFTHGRGKSSLVALLFWPVVFVSLGWNFLEFGIFRTGSNGLAWTICGAVFLIMAPIPIYVGVKQPDKLPFKADVLKIDKSTLWPQLIAAAAGIPLGILFFALVS